MVLQVAMHTNTTMASHMILATSRMNAILVTTKTKRGIRLKDTDKEPLFAHTSGQENIHLVLTGRKSWTDKPKATRKAPKVEERETKVARVENETHPQDVFNHVIPP